ncbi:MAG: MgtC/SapB family protein [Solobacterium sp.]|nr:MgtC/SapB family protein [Solobacterium sp.]
MLTIFDSLRNFTALSVTFRLLLSFACGTVIGLERSYKNKPAGFRTHTLVCLAACIASITGLYLYMVEGMPTDISRIGAQVISGLGFIGAGTIIVTKDNRVKGLTTAAGMWTAGIIGLAIGATFYEGGIAATIMVLLIETVMDRIRKSIRRTTTFRIALTYYNRTDLDVVLRYCKNIGLAITNLQVTGTNNGNHKIYSALVELKTSMDIDHTELVQKIDDMPGVVSTEEI